MKDVADTECYYSRWKKRDRSVKSVDRLTNDLPLDTFTFRANVATRLRSHRSDTSLRLQAAEERGPYGVGLRNLVSTRPAAYILAAARAAVADVSCYLRERFCGSFGFKSHR